MKKNKDRAWIKAGALGIFTYTFFLKKNIIPQFKFAVSLSVVLMASLFFLATPYPWLSAACLTALTVIVCAVVTYCTLLRYKNYIESSPVWQWKFLKNNVEKCDSFLQRYNTYKVDALNMPPKNQQSFMEAMDRCKKYWEQVKERSLPHL